MGSGLRTLTVIAVEETGCDKVLAVIVTEWPAPIVDEGEYTPEVVIRPVVVLPPAKPLTNQATGVGAPPKVALYCALLPCLIWVEPIIETRAVVCA